MHDQHHTCKRPVYFNKNNQKCTCWQEIKHTLEMDVDVMLQKWSEHRCQRKRSKWIQSSLRENHTNSYSICNSSKHFPKEIVMISAFYNQVVTQFLFPNYQLWQYVAAFTHMNHYCFALLSISLQIGNRQNITNLFRELYKVQWMSRTSLLCVDFSFTNISPRPFLKMYVENTFIYLFIFYKCFNAHC